MKRSLKKSPGLGGGYRRISLRYRVWAAHESQHRIPTVNMFYGAQKRNTMNVRNLALKGTDKS